MGCRSLRAGPHLTRSSAPGQARPQIRGSVRGGAPRRHGEAPRPGRALGEAGAGDPLGEIGAADPADAGGLARRLEAVAAGDLPEAGDELELRRGAVEARL